MVHTYAAKQSVNYQTNKKFIDSFKDIYITSERHILETNGTPPPLKNKRKKKSSFNMRNVK